MQPAWVLGRQPYRDSSYLVHFLTASDGRLSAIVKGAHRKQRGGMMAALMQPFQPLLVKFGGNSELKYVVTAESAGISRTLVGETLFSGLYLNELLTRLLPKFDAVPTLFGAYGDAIEVISTSAEPELTLRRFELLLLEELGYQIQWQHDCEGRPIKQAVNYSYQPERGFVSSQERDASFLVSGVQLLTLADWQRSSCAIDEICQAKLKGVMRLAIDQRLGGRPLKVREAVSDWRQLKE
jgi:DNA repair protein RecO (recombination protein O)